MRGVLTGLVLSLAASKIINPLPAYDYVAYSLSALGLVILAGLMSGLNVGMLSIDELELSQRIASGSDAEKTQARRILRVLSRHHWLLVSTLLGNCIALETLPIVLNFMFNTTTSILLSVTFVLFFGEVIPQAIMTGPNQMKIAGRLVPIVQFTMVILSPVSFPIALLLDRLLGKSPQNQFTVTDLKRRIELQRGVVGNCSEDSQMSINHDQLNMITECIDLKERRVKDFMTPLHQVFAVSENQILDQELLRQFRKRGVSRVPVYRGHHKDRLFGYIMVSQFIGVKAFSLTRVLDCTVIDRHPVITTLETDMLTLFQYFKETNSSIAFVVSPSSPSWLSDIEEEYESSVSAVGIVTLKDVFSAVLRAEILAESFSGDSVGYWECCQSHQRTSRSDELRASDLNVCRVVSLN
jgi:CBS domain containing-hemolysin-like protein